MASLNKWIGIGNLGKDPEVKVISNGTSVAKFSIACTEKYKDKSGEMKEVTEWISVEAWGKLAEICGKWLSKGKQVYIEGKLKTEKYEKDGVTKYSTKIVASEMKMLGGKGDSNGQSNSAQSAGNSAPNAASAPIDDEIPF
jgi:single-strand DNA-binding protein